MKKVFLVVASVLSVTISPDVFCAEEKSIEQLVQRCIVCHGAYGLSNAPGIPSIAGQPKIYLAMQLKHYRDGTREHEFMNSIAKYMTDSDIERVSEYFSKHEIELKSRQEAQ